jgi:hypothetical protein
MQVPVLVWRSSRPDLGIEVAKARELTQIGYGRGGQMHVYSGEERMTRDCVSPSSRSQQREGGPTGSVAQGRCGGGSHTARGGRVPGQEPGIRSVAQADESAFLDVRGAGYPHRTGGGAVASDQKNYGKMVLLVRPE